jgi:hypothetical protein
MLDTQKLYEFLSHLCLARIKSAFEMNNIQRAHVTCYMEDILLLRSFGEGQGGFKATFEKYNTCPALRDLRADISSSRANWFHSAFDSGIAAKPSLVSAERGRRQDKPPPRNDNDSLLNRRGCCVNPLKRNSHQSAGPELSFRSALHPCRSKLSRHCRRASRDIRIRHPV